MHLRKDPLEERYYASERSVLPRFTPGVDWGSEWVVLVEDRRVDPPRRLTWQKAHKAWVDNVTGWEHATAELCLDLEGSGANGRRYSVTLSEGGRLSKRRLEEHRDAIDKVFGEGTTDALSPHRTLVIAPVAPPQEELPLAPQAEPAPEPVYAGEVEVCYQGACYRAVLTTDGRVTISAQGVEVGQAYLVDGVLMDGPMLGRDAHTCSRIYTDLEAGLASLEN